MKKIACLIICCTYICCIYSQQSNILQINNPYKVPPTPEAAAFLKYGEYPVSQNTGIPDISIPIYTIRSGELTLPISLSYHAGGIKIEELAGSVGLGWTLNAGGVVNKTVMSTPDRGDFEFPAAAYIRQEGYNNADKKYAHSMWSLLSESVFTIRPEGSLIVGPDRERDIYSYSFQGNSGIFFLAEGKVNQYPYTDNQIINLSNNLYVPDDSGFKIITPDGVSYFFKAVERSTIHSTTSTISRVRTHWETDPEPSNIPSISGHVPLEVITAWFLTRIESADGKSFIDFEYMNGETVNDYTVSDSYSYSADNVGGGSINPYTASYSIATATRTSRTPLLKEIRFSEGKITFNYLEDRLDRRKYRLANISIFNNSGIVNTKIVFDNNKYFHGKRLKLGALSFLGGNNTEYDSYAFEYYEQLIMPDYPSSSNAEHQTRCGYYQQDLCGYYNGASDNMCMLPYLPEPYSGLPIYMTPANRNFSFEYAQTYSLKKIKYITGGETEFTYDAYEGYIPRSPALRIKEIRSSTDGTINNTAKHIKYTYSNIYAPMVDYKDYITFKSGSYERSVHQAGCNTGACSLLKTSYHQGYSSTPVNSGAMGLYQYRYEKVEESIVDVKDITKEIRTVYEFEDIPVVKEYPAEDNARIMGRLYEYNIDFVDLNWLNNVFTAFPSRETFSDLGFNQVQMYKDNWFPYFIDMSWTGPTLKKKSVYSYSNKEYTLLEETENSYEYYNRNNKLRRGISIKGLLPSFRGAANSDGSGGANNPENVYYRTNFFIDDFFFYDIYVSTGWKKLVSIVTKKYEKNTNSPFSTSESLQYGAITASDNPHSFPTIKRENYNNAGTVTYEYKYPRDFKGQGVYNTMLTQHQISPVVETVKRDGVYTIKENTVYGETSAGIKPTAYTLNTAKGADTQFREIKILSYDKAGNPTHIMLGDGMSVVCIWENNNLIAEIKNAELSIVSSLINSQGELSRYNAGAGVSASTIAYLRTSLPDAHVRSFSYKPLVGITSVTGPDGVKTNYNYDDAGRLSSIIDWKNNPLQKFEYKFRSK